MIITTLKQFISLTSFRYRISSSESNWQLVVTNLLTKFKSHGRLTSFVNSQLQNIHKSVLHYNDDFIKILQKIKYFQNIFASNETQKGRDTHARCEVVENRAFCRNIRAVTKICNSVLSTAVKCFLLRLNQADSFVSIIVPA